VALVELVRHLDQAKIDRYAQVSGDHNPLHVDPAFAARTQFGGTVAHGMLLLAYVSEALARAWGRRWLEGGRLRARFRLPARPGDALTVRVLPRGSASCLVEVLDGKGQVLVSAEAEAAETPASPPQKGGDTPG
jgi:acyl dehydratase